jgi:hypothetical protein
LEIFVKSIKLPHRRRVAIALGLVVFLCISWRLVAWYQVSGYARSAPLKTEAWGTPGFLAVLDDLTAQGTLLLRHLTIDEEVRVPKIDKDRWFSHVPNDPLYRFTPGAETLELVENRYWSVSCGPTTDELQQLLPSDFTVALDYGTRTLRHDGKVLPTTGRSVLRVALSPNQRYCAVLSADGEYRQDMLFGTTVGGYRYHQVFRTNDGSEVGSAVILNKTTRSDDITLCWSPNLRYVLYYDMYFRNLWVIAVPIPDTGGNNE